MITIDLIKEKNIKINKCDVILTDNNGVYMVCRTQEPMYLLTDMKSGVVYGIKEAIRNQEELVQYIEADLGEKILVVIPSNEIKISRVK